MERKEYPFILNFKNDILEEIKRKNAKNPLDLVMQKKKSVLMQLNINKSIKISPAISLIYFRPN